MRKVPLAVILVILLISGIVSAQDYTGKKIGGGYLSYAFGMGDAFKEIGGVDLSAGIGLGGMFHYGLKERLLLGGELGFQSYDIGSDGETKLNLLGSMLYNLNYSYKNALFLTGGLGYYGGLDGIGIHAGIIYRMYISERVALFGMPRLHYVFSDPSAQMLQIAFGAQMEFGGY